MKNNIVYIVKCDVGDWDDAYTHDIGIADSKEGAEILKQLFIDDINSKIALIEPSPVQIPEKEEDRWTEEQWDICEIHHDWYYKTGMYKLKKYHINTIRIDEIELNKINYAEVL